MRKTIKRLLPYLVVLGAYIGVYQIDSLSGHYSRTFEMDGRHRYKVTYGGDFVKDAIKWHLAYGDWHVHDGDCIGVIFCPLLRLDRAFWHTTHYATDPDFVPEANGSTGDYVESLQLNGEYWKMEISATENPGRMVIPERVPAGQLPSVMKPAWASSAGDDQYGYWADLTVKGVTQRMRWCPPGTFTMGISEAEIGQMAGPYLHGGFQVAEFASEAFDEGSRHVTLSKGFWIAESACTQELWQTVKGSNKSFFRGEPQLPVESVSWYEAQAFLWQLNDLIHGGTVLLPTEAQREYACRAGTQSAYSGPSLDALGWYGKNSRRHPHPVKQKSPNSWGLFDMHGNVQEWCADWYSVYPSGAVTDPMSPTAFPGPLQESARVTRGGSWDSSSSSCMSGRRNRRSAGAGDYDVGFRIVVQSDQSSSP